MDYRSIVIWGFRSLNLGNQGDKGHIYLFKQVPIVEEDFDHLTNGISNCLPLPLIKAGLKFIRSWGLLLLIRESAVNISSLVTSLIKSLFSSSKIQGLKESNNSGIILGFSDLNLLEKSLINTFAISLCLSNRNPSVPNFPNLIILLLLRETDWKYLLFLLLIGSKSALILSPFNFF